MKSKLIRSSKATETEPSYPALYKAANSGLVVLATGKKAGTVVVPNLVYETGEYLSSRYPFDDSRGWLRLSRGEKVALEND